MTTDVVIQGEQMQSLQITDAEWEVMLSVWEADNQSAGEIIARVQPLRERSHRTVRTLLARLVEKKAVSVRIEGSQHLYSAAISRETCVRVAALSFGQRFFQGDVKSLLMHFVEHESLSQDEINELREQLDSFKDKAGTQAKNSSKPSSDRKKKS
jgi:BlaI family penicillinase repressor